MQYTDNLAIIKRAWAAYDNTKTVRSIIDASPHVSTNRVFKVNFDDRPPVFAKLSSYGKFEHFKEEHIIINNLAINLGSPYENFLARSLMQKNGVFFYKYKRDDMDAWVVFYNPIRIKHRLPRRLEPRHITKLGRELARFHKACRDIRNVLPSSSKTIVSDIQHLQRAIQEGAREYHPHETLILEHCHIFIEQTRRLHYNTFETFPVFIDWNIGNFSVTGDGKFYSRWDMVEEIVGKKFIRFGKPDAQMFMFAYEHIKAQYSIEKNEILMVGDTLFTDIMGGNKFGLDTALVLSGTTQPHQAHIKIAATGIIPTYVCDSVIIEE